MTGECSKPEDCCDTENSYFWCEFTENCVTYDYGCCPLTWVYCPTDGKCYKAEEKEEKCCVNEGEEYCEHTGQCEIKG